jgi:hypothetical protein
MPEQLPDLPDLATPLAAATVTPPFEQIVARARRRRRRQVVGVASVAAAVLAVVATGTALTGGDRNTLPQPTRPSGSPTSTATAREVDAAGVILGGGLVSYAAGPDGSVLTVWKACGEADGSTCRSAWQLQTDHDTYQGLAQGDTPVAHSAGDAFVVKAWNSKGVVVAADGTVRPLSAGEPGELTPDDALVPGRNGLLVADARTATTWPLPRPAGVERWTQPVVSTDGTIWGSTLVGDQVQVWWTGDATATSGWQHRSLPGDQPGSDLPGYTAVAGQHVATMSGSDGATILPVVDFAVTTDGGATWRDLRRGDVPFDSVDAMAATSGGTLYVVTAGGEHLFRTTDDTWTRFVEMPNPDHIDALVPAGDRVLAQGGSYDSPVLLELDTEGHATKVPLAR